MGLQDKAASAGSHYGLEIMTERARRIGGTLEVGPRASGGTGVRADLLPATAPHGRRRGAGLMATPRIVLIDDHALCRNGLSDLLRHRGGMDVLAAVSDRSSCSSCSRAAARPGGAGPACPRPTA